MALISPENTVPLSLEYVMERRPFAAKDSPLLNKLPVEILDRIIYHVDRGDCELETFGSFSSHTTYDLFPYIRLQDLSSLALVNSDCRQIARACQFKTVRLDPRHPTRSQGILDVLRAEAKQRKKSRSGLTLSPSLGVCIRSFSVTHHFEYLRPLHFNSRQSNYHRALRPHCLMRQRERANSIFKAKFVCEGDDRTSTAFRAFPALTRLENFNCFAVRDLTQHYLDTLVHSGASHLGLAVALTDDIPQVKAPWPVKHLDLGVIMGGAEGSDKSQHFDNLLRACAPTLECLGLTLDKYRDRPGTEAPQTGGATVTPIMFDLEFPMLKFLTCMDSHRVSRFGDSAMRSLVLNSPRLETLVLGVDNPSCVDILQTAGCIPSLRTLVIEHLRPRPLVFGNTGPGDDAYSIFGQFLERNCQLKVFQCRRPFTPQSLLPILNVLQGTQLTRLCLAWLAKEIPTSSLQALAKLRSVEDLWIQCDELREPFLYGGYDSRWHPDTEALREGLKPLSKLTRLCLTCDRYPYDEGEWFSTSASIRRIVGPEVRAYAEVFPRLEQMRMGGKLFDIVRTGDGPTEFDSLEQGCDDFLSDLNRIDTEDVWDITPYTDPVLDFYGTNQRTLRNRHLEGMMYIPNHRNLRLMFIRRMHNNAAAGHPG